MYMQGFDVLNDEEGIGIPYLYAIGTLIDTEHDKRPITAQEFIHEQETDLYSRQVSSTVGLPESKFHYDNTVFLVLTAPIDWQNQKSLLSLYNCPFYVTPTVQHWLDIWGKPYVPLDAARILFAT